MTPTNFVALFTVIGVTVLLGGAVALALGWAFRDGQFDNFEQGSRSIFGPDEPIGEPTDAFPGEGGDWAGETPGELHFREGEAPAEPPSQRLG